MAFLRTLAPIRVNKSLIIYARMLVHIICLAYAGTVFYDALMGNLLGDPVQYLTDFSGIGAINLLMLSLCISPISQYFRFAQLMPLRKTLGVYAAVYALLHLLVFIAFELQFEWQLIASEIIKRPYITVGFVALLILTSLYISSFDFVKKRMGRQWQRLHNYVYLALFLACLHFLWSIKSTELAPIIYAIAAFALLLLRKKKLKNIFK